MEKISKKQYEDAKVRMEQLLPFISNDTPIDDKNMVEFNHVSDIIEMYENDKYPSYQPSLGEIIQEAIYEYGYTVKQAAQKLNISVRKLNSFINNRSEPSLQTARDLCTELHISASDVLGVG